ncbi:MAG: protein-export chaperone SecB [Gammaproteobacteria bacterium]|nr:MAG: protein-export chaperone SecB [Gammaproteobacteria bacterium]
MTEENTQAAEAQGQPTQAGFAIQKIYLKDISFETPSGLEAFTKAWKPNVQQDLNIQVTTVEEGLFEVLLLLTITARIENKVVFLVEVKQGGLFAISGLDGIQLSHAINTLCPQILFPYARETIDSLLVRGGFPPLMLAPINFDAVFAQAVMQAQQQAEANAEGKPAEAALN